MAENYKDSLNKLLFAYWGNRASIRTSTGVTLYSFVYGMEEVLPIEIAIPSFRVIAESRIPVS